MLKSGWIIDYKRYWIFNIIIYKDKNFYSLLNDFLWFFYLNKFLLYYKFTFKKKLFNFYILNFTFILKNFFFNKIYILKLIGLGFFIEKYTNNILWINLGYSHYIYLKLPQSITIKINLNKTEIHLSSPNKNLIKFIISQFLKIKKSTNIKFKGFKLLLNKF